MNSTATKNVKQDHFGTFVGALSALLDVGHDEAQLLQDGAKLLRQLVAVDDWLPSMYAQPDPVYYRQYLLHADAQQRFSVVSFVWGPGQFTPVHDHTVWGVIGMLRGAEYSQSYQWNKDGLQPLGNGVRIEPGMVEIVSPNVAGFNDIHQVRNAYDDRVSISIHVYGADIGKVKRSVYLPDGTRKVFISGYSN